MKDKVLNKPLEAKKASPLLVSISAVIIGMLAGCLLILLIGKDPINGYKNLFMGALSNKRKIGATIGLSTQLIFAGLSFSFAYTFAVNVKKAHIINIIFFIKTSIIIITLKSI